MSPEEIAELSRLLDEALAREASQRGPWLSELEQAKPRLAQRLRSMLRQADDDGGTTSLPSLANLGSDEAVATAGERVGPYRLVQEIGRGGMGSVWLAERADGAYRRRALSCRGWCGPPALASAWRVNATSVRCSSIRTSRASMTPESMSTAVRISRCSTSKASRSMRTVASTRSICGRMKLFIEVAHAVAYAHGRLVLHRDLKPANVMVDAAGHVHLLDFGIAKLLDDTGAGADLTQEQGRALTLNYASPEQIACRPLGVTADVYALGVMLYELMTGTLPYTAKRNTTGAMEEAILAGDAPSPSSRVADKRSARELWGDLDAILAKAIKRDPAERYPTADALAADIQRYLDGRPIEARPDSAWYRLRKAVVRHRVPVTAVTAVLVVTVAGATTTFLQGRRAAVGAEEPNSPRSLFRNYFG